MNPQENIKRNNYSVVEIGSSELWKGYTTTKVNSLPGMEIPGKFFLNDVLALTSMEISINYMPAGGKVPFLHKHKSHEEVYLFLKGQSTNTLAWINALIKGSVNPVKPISPVVIYWGNKDVTNPPVMGKLYQDQMCKLGGNVDRVQLAGDQSHFTTPGASAPLYLSWVKDRVAGKSLVNACPQTK